MPCVFLTSQPIIYLIELPTLGWDKAMYYYLHIWLPISLLTLPGGAVAFFAKKQNVLGAVILGIGNTIVALMGVSYFLKLYSAFPRHLLTVISCARSLSFLFWECRRGGKQEFCRRQRLYC